MCGDAPPPACGTCKIKGLRLPLIHRRDATGTTVKLAPFSVYPHFDDGDIKEFSPPKTIFTLKVPGGGSFPKTCVAALILAEKDSGDLTTLAQEAFDKATSDMEELRGRGGVWDPPDPGEALRKWVGEVTGLDDDVFPPQAVTLSVASEDFRWGDGTKLSPETTVEFRGHDGVYCLVFYWEIRTVESVRPWRGEVVNPVGGGVLHP